MREKPVTVEDSSEPSHGRRPPSLGLFDAVSVIVGIVVGSSIYKVSPAVFANVSTPATGLMLWVLGGALSLVGAFCYAELATTYPRSGGDYVYLTRAYGPLVGFLFGWTHLGGILTGSIGAMAFVFAEYARPLLLPAASDAADVPLAIGAIVVLSVLNLLGVVLGKWAQNVLTLAKVVGLGAIVVSGLGWGSHSVVGDGAAAPTLGPGPSLALIFILYAYGGWNDAAFVAAEVRDTRRNLPRALLLGITGIALIYLLVNVAYLRALGFDGLRASETPAADALVPLFGVAGKQAMRVLVAVSALGALNGLIFTGSRVHATLGADHRLFAWLAHWHPRRGTPVWSLVAQMLITSFLVAFVGLKAWHALLDGFVDLIGWEAIPWDKFGGGFQTLVSATAPIFWTFFLLTGFSVILLRRKDGPIIRPFRVPLFPLTPLLFCGMCAFMVYNSLDYARGLSLVGLAPLALGVPAYFISRRGTTQGGSGATQRMRDEG